MFYEAMQQYIYLSIYRPQLFFPFLIALFALYFVR